MLVFIDLRKFYILSYFSLALIHSSEPTLDGPIPPVLLNTLLLEIALVSGSNFMIDDPTPEKVVCSVYLPMPLLFRLGSLGVIDCLSL